jgi:hypothetical protein
MQYLGIVGEICAALNGQLDDHRAKAAMIWILGEYADRIDNAGDIIDSLFLEEFLEDTPDVQLAILTAVFKYFLVKDDGEDMFQSVITMATKQVDNPDVRDRAFMYYYLISEHPDEAQAIIKPDEPQLIKTELYSINTDLVNKLIPQIGTIAILYDKLPEDFVETTHIMSLSLEDGELGGKTTIEEMELPIVVPGKDQGTLEVRAQLQQIGAESSIVLRCTNYSNYADSIKNIAFNKNIFGFAQGGNLPFPKDIPEQKSITVQVPLTFQEDHTVGAQPSAELQIAILTNSPTPIIFSVPLKLETILRTGEEGGKFSRQEFMNAFQEIPQSSERTVEVHGARLDSIPVAKPKFNASRLFFNAKKDQTAYFTAKTITNEVVLAFVVFGESGQLTIGVRMNNMNISSIILKLVSDLVK